MRLVDALAARAEAAEEELLSVDAHGVRDAFQLREEIAGLTAERDALAARVADLTAALSDAEDRACSGGANRPLPDRAGGGR